MMYSPYDISHKYPFGAVAAGTDIRFTLNLPKTIWPLEGGVNLLVYPADSAEPCNIIPMWPQPGSHTANLWYGVYTPASPALLYYRFQIGGRFLAKGPGAKGEWAPDGQPGEPWQLTVYTAGQRAPSFLPGGVMYQIFPDRFCKGDDIANVIGATAPLPPGKEWREDWGGMPKYCPGPDGEYDPNDFFGGNLKGIAKKLDYLAALGVTCLYLNPVFEAHSNHRYDTGDYHKIDPLLGCEDDLKALCQSAARRGIRVILDGVFSHTGSDSLYFNRAGHYGDGGAYRDPESPYRSWYHFANWPDTYDCWWNFITLPNTNETDPGFLDFICGDGGVLARWINAGVAGFRLDVADELPDIFLDRLYDRVKLEDPDAAVIGEVWEDASNKISYGQRRRYLLGGQLDSVMNYPFLKGILHFVRYGDGAAFLEMLMEILDHYPAHVVNCLMNSLSTHDSIRAITALAGEEMGGRDRHWQADHHDLARLDPHAYALGKRMFMLACVLQYTLPGVPCLYYGDEAGMTGYKDPFNRCCYPWGAEDGELVAHLTALGQLRKEHAILGDAEFYPLFFAGDLAAFVRDGQESGSVIVAVNRGNAEAPLPQSMLPAGANTELVVGRWQGGVLGPQSAVVLSALE